MPCFQLFRLQLIGKAFEGLNNIGSTYEFTLAAPIKVLPYDDEVQRRQKTHTLADNPCSVRCHVVLAGDTTPDTKILSHLLACHQSSRFLYSPPDAIPLQSDNPRNLLCPVCIVEGRDPPLNGFQIQTRHYET